MTIYQIDIDYICTKKQIEGIMAIGPAGSGLDINGIVSQLVQSEITPLQKKHDFKQKNIDTNISVYGQIKSSLSKLQNTLTRLADIKQFYSLKAANSAPDSLGATITGKPDADKYNIEIKHLATRQSLVSTAIPTTTESLGTGSLTINFGTYSSNDTVFTANSAKTPLTLNITAGQNNLTAIRDAINKSNAGISASIVQDQSGAHLSLSSPDTGKNLAMKITVNDDDGNSTDGSGLSRLAYDPTIGVARMTQFVAAQDSEVTINGFTLIQSSNQITQGINGMTLDLKKEAIGTIITLSVSKDTDKAAANINDLIKQYNENISFLNSISAYDKENKKGGFLQADAGIRNLKLSLSRWVGTSISSEVSSLQSLADLGIRSDKTGLLSIKDQTKFNQMITDHFDDVGKLFAKTAVSTDSGITVNAVGKTMPAGRYTVNLSDFTPGSVLTGTIGQGACVSTDGLTLTGTGKYSSLSINVLSGGTGNRGDIIVSDGLGAQLDTMIDSFLGTSGNITTQLEQLKQRSKDLIQDQDKIELKQTQLTTRYKKQFTSLDGIISKLQSASDFLSRQFAKS